MMTFGQKAKHSSTRVITWRKRQRHVRWLRSTSVRLSFSSMRSDTGKNCYIDFSLLLGTPHSSSVQERSAPDQTWLLHKRLRPGAGRTLASETFRVIG